MTRSIIEGALDGINRNFRVNTCQNWKYVHVHVNGEKMADEQYSWKISDGIDISLEKAPSRDGIVHVCLFNSERDVLNLEKTGADWPFD